MPEITAPIALFVYKRPPHTRRALEALAQNPLAVHSDLFIFSDGPADSASVALVQEVRRLVAAARGFRSIKILERPDNIGLAASITQGVGSLCADYGRVIVVEDDLRVAPDFLAFMNRALDYYENEEAVMQISGFQFPLREMDRRECVFLPIISCWGWAVWERAWKAYDPSASGFARIKVNRQDRRRFDLAGAYDYFDLLRKQLAGKVDSWGIRWYLSVFLRDGLVLYPPHSLVLNTGFDGSGTHAVVSMSEVDAAFGGSFPSIGTEESFVLPTAITLSQPALREVKAILRGARPSVVTRLMRRLGI